MLSLYNQPPNKIEFDGEILELDLSFDGVLYATDVLKDKTMTDLDKAETFCRLLLVDDVEEADWVELFFELQELLLPSNKALKYDQNGEVIKAPTKKVKSDFDFNYDADALYSAFMEAYRIDLIDQQGKLHWYKFLALLQSLPEDTNFMQIRQIRSTDLAEIKDKDRKKALRKAKKELALPDDDEDEEGGDTYE